MEVANHHFLNVMLCIFVERMATRRSPSASREKGRSQRFNRWGFEKNKFSGVYGRGGDLVPSVGGGEECSRVWQR